MPVLHLLGTGAALSDPHRTTTMLAIADDSEAGPVLLVDCGGDAIQRLMSAGPAIDRIAGLVLTHEHPDHVGGFPLLMERLWLAGRRTPLPVYGPAAALDQADRLFRAFDTHDWEGMPEVVPLALPLEEGAPVIDDGPWRVTASPGAHGRVPVVGLRIESRRGGVLAYSSDTRPSPSIARMARDADLLVHEATEEAPQVHSTAEQAATIAREAGARRLVLVHLPPAARQPESALARARAAFHRLEMGEELGRYPF